MEEWPEIHCFDEAFYKATYDVSEEPAIAHFRSVGDARGFDPSPYFSTEFYKNKYPDWAKDGAATALGDCITRLVDGEIRQPHPLIDLEWYKARYPELPDTWVDVFLHFVRHGDDELRSPSGAFDADFYGKTYLETGAGGALRHYETKGKYRGHATTPSRKTAQQTKAVWGAIAKTSSIVIGAHDGQNAGVPLMAYDMACSAKRHDLSPIFVLDRAGPLLERLQTVGPVVVAAEGWDIGALADELPGNVCAVILSTESARLATSFAGAGISTSLLVHEMKAYVAERDLIAQVKEAQLAGARIVVSYPRLAQAFEAEFGDIEVIRPGIVTPRTSLAQFKRAQKAVGKSWPVFIGAGQGSRRKGFDRFVEAAFALASKHENAAFVWLGTLEPWAAELAEDAQRQGLKILLPGFVNDYLAWYRTADVYLLTSRQDPGPSTAFHAARMGVPFVAYQSDIAMIGQFGRKLVSFAPEGDLGAFVSAVEHYLSTETRKMRRKRRRLVAKYGGFDRYLDDVLRITRQA